jgi:DUF218 domain
MEHDSTAEEVSTEVNVIVGDDTDVSDPYTHLSFDDENAPRLRPNTGGHAAVAVASSGPQQALHVVGGYSRRRKEEAAAEAEAFAEAQRLEDEKCYNLCVYILLPLFGTLSLVGALYLGLSSGTVYPNRLVQARLHHQRESVRAVDVLLPTWIKTVDKDVQGASSGALLPSDSYMLAIKRAIDMYHHADGYQEFTKANILPKSIDTRIRIVAADDVQGGGGSGGQNAQVEAPPAELKRDVGFDAATLRCFAHVLLRSYRIKFQDYRLTDDIAAIVPPQHPQRLDHYALHALIPSSESLKAGDDDTARHHPPHATPLEHVPLENRAEEAASAVELPANVEPQFLVVLGNMPLDECCISIASVGNVLKAVEYYLHNSADTFLVLTGGPTVGHVSEAVMMGLVALSRGVPRSRILLEPRARSTRENSIYSARVVKRWFTQHHRPVPKNLYTTLVSKPSHLEWALPIFKSQDEFTTIKPLVAMTTDDAVISEMRSYLSHVDPSSARVRARLNKLEQGISGVD